MLDAVSLRRRWRVVPGRSSRHSKTGRFHMRTLSEDDRLVCRITHLRTLLCHTTDAEIVVALNEFIAETATELVSPKPDQRRKMTLH